MTVFFAVILSMLSINSRQFDTIKSCLNLFKVSADAFRELFNLHAFRQAFAWTIFFEADLLVENQRLGWRENITIKSYEIRSIR
jgi:hypothetical protein